MADVQMIGKDMFDFEIVFLIDCEQSGWQWLFFLSQLADWGYSDPS